MAIRTFDVNKKRLKNPFKVRYVFQALIISIFQFHYFISDPVMSNIMHMKDWRELSDTDNRHLQWTTDICNGQQTSATDRQMSTIDEQMSPSHFLFSLVCWIPQAR